MKRGGNKTHQFILYLNMLTLLAIILFVSIKNIDINFSLVILGFSPSIIAIVINAVIENKITEGYYFLFIPSRNDETY